MHGNEVASSPAFGAILLITITLILAALIMLMAPGLPHLSLDTEIPAVFEITKIRHTNKYNVLNYESYMVIKNSGKISYDNRNLYAKTYRNGELLQCIIPTMNGHNFIHFHPYGIKTLGGPGSNNYLWYPEALIAIDYNDGTFRPGDTVQFEVYDRTTGRLISRDTYPHAEEDKKEKWMELYLSHQGA